MSKKYYLAYGSNLSMGQMAERCPDAVYVGTAEIADYQLLFKGSLTGSYLTIEKKKGIQFRCWFGRLVQGMKNILIAMKAVQLFITKRK